MTTTSGQRGEYAKTARRRREIIAAAVDVFAESGFRDGALREVADRAGITHATIRYHFPTKVDLLEAVLRWRDDEALAIGSASGPEGVDVVHTWLAEIARNLATPALVELELTLAAEAISPEHPAHEYFRDRHDRATRLLRRAFRQIQARGQLVVGYEPEPAARAVVAATMGLQELWIWDRSIDVVGELRQFVQRLLTIVLEPVSAT